LPQTASEVKNRAERRVFFWLAGFLILVFGGGFAAF
jgi:hypothetical protein